MRKVFGTALTPVLVTGLSAVTVLTAFSAQGAPAITSFGPSLADPRLVGTTVVWTASATDSEAGVLAYRFRVLPPGGVYAVVQDFNTTTTFEWTGHEKEGTYQIELAVQNRGTGQRTTRVESFRLLSRVAAGGPAVVSATSHPLIGYYSAPACAAGSKMRAQFRKVNTQTWFNTPFQNCEPPTSMNFYLAGMEATSTYTVRHEVHTGSAVSASPTLSFTTGPITITNLPTMTVRNAADAPNNTEYPYVAHSFAVGSTGYMAQSVTNLNGKVVWYYNKLGGRLMRPQLNGGFTTLAGAGNVARMVDVAGNTVWETNVAALNEKLVAKGYQPITSIHHDAVILPNGKIALLCSIERVFNNVQGHDEVDLIADSVVVLHRNSLDVMWYWNAFDHMDVNRKAILDETCFAIGGGCPPYYLRPVAKDWMHTNSVSYTPDGHFLLSVRHHDWVIKINFAQGAGDGRILWRLGREGDFAIVSSDPSPWFTHQHDPEMDMGTTTLLTVYDNGNTRQTEDPNALSRGQAYLLDEKTMKATPVLNRTLATYANRIGAAQALPSGAYHFTSGAVDGAADKAWSQEVRADGLITFVLEASVSTYRSFRLRDMYRP